jgi:hypothetical protein
MMKIASRLAGLLFIWICVSSWGFMVHRTINQLAIYELPPNLRTFFHSNMEYLVRHSVRPDLRRSDDSLEDARHFINLEFFGDSAAWKLPQNWLQAVSRYSRKSFLKHGHLPYHIMEIKHRLTISFRNRHRDSVLFYAADLAHYISDAHVPLHTTTNYDGQLTGQKGLHSLWESFIPELSLESYELSSNRKAKYLKSPETKVWNAVRTAHQLTSEVFRQEKEASRNFTDATKYRVQVRKGVEVRNYTSEFAKAYAARLGGSINKQLLAAAALTADFWYTSWVDAGQPDIRLFMTGPVNAAQKAQLKKESRSFRQNMLIRDSLLIARKSGGTSAQKN